MVRVVKYAGNAANITEAYTSSNYSWSQVYNAVGNNDTNYASCNVPSSGVTGNLLLHDYDFNLPEDVRINSITVEFMISADNGTNTYAPTVSLIWGETRTNDLNSSDSSWTDGTALMKKGGVSSSNPMDNLNNHPIQPTTYTMEIPSTVCASLNSETINKNGFGVYFRYMGKGSSASGNIHVHWAKITMDYDVESYAITVNGDGYLNEHDAESNKYDVNSVGSTTFVSTPLTNINSGKEYSVSVDIPVGLDVQSVVCTNSYFDEDTNLWVCEPNKKATLKIEVTYSIIGTLKITLNSSKAGLLEAYYGITANNIPTYHGVTITQSELRKYTDGYIVFQYTFSHGHLTETQRPLYFYIEEMSDTNIFKGYELDTTASSKGIKIVEEYPESIVIDYSNVTDTVSTIKFKAFIRPRITGEVNLSVGTLMWPDAVVGTKKIHILDPYVYHVELKSSDIKFAKSRIVSRISTGAYVLPCRTAPYDANILIKKPTLNMKMYKDLDYIGCVKLEQTHYSPKSTYKDTLLNTNYKNKRYMGKKLASDETITLNVRLHPYDVTTVQGMVDMDKPVPINTNHLCFEGDALNHRGWCELYGISCTKTNPAWYDCDIDVKYITHNINTRFQIIKGGQVSDYFLPNLMKDTMLGGEDIGEFFNVDSTGSFIYSDKLVDNTKRNSFVVDEGQYIRLTTKDKLSQRTYLTFNWDTSRIVENKDNNMSRVLRIVDSKTGNAVLEYEYYDLDFSESYYYSGRVICRQLYKGAYKTILNRPINLHSDVEYDGSDKELDTYGSKVVFELMGNSLTLLDEGLSGKEIYLEDITLEDGSYYFEAYFQNNNQDIDTPPIVNFFDVTMKELELTSDYSEYYKNIVVSPFPVPYHKVVFTRDSQEGTIFYLYDDGNEISYNLSPFYQYYTGVNLESKDGISLINLDNSYNVVAINNGLVKLTINRLNGNMVLYKYNRKNGLFVVTNQLQLTKYDDLNINSFDDDKIELQASDTIITMWRGRPFIQFTHPTEDILLKERVTGVYGENVNGNATEYPTMVNLVNNDNLFPACVGSLRNIRSECIGVETIEADWSSEGNLSISSNDTVGLSQWLEIECASTTHEDNSPIYFIVDGEVIDTVGYLEFDKGFKTSIMHKFNTLGKHTVQAIMPDTVSYREGSTSFGYAVSNILEIEVFDDYYRIELLFSDKMHFEEEDFKARLTYGGEPVNNETLVFTTGDGNTQSYSKQTGEDGIAILENHLIPKEWRIAVAFNDPDNTETYPEWEGLGQIVESKMVTITQAYVDIEVENTTVQRHNQLKVKVLYNNGKPLADGIVLLTIHGVTYTRITDAEGMVSLNINLLTGSYDLNVSFAGTGFYYPVSRTYDVEVID